MFRLKKKKMNRDANRQPVARVASHDYAAAYPQEYFFHSPSNEDDQEIEVEAYSRRWCVIAVVACVLACSINVAAVCGIGIFLNDANAMPRVAAESGKTGKHSSDITDSAKIRAFTLNADPAYSSPPDAAARVKDWNATNRETNNIALQDNSYFVIQGNVTDPIVQIYSHLCFKPPLDGECMFRQAIRKQSSESGKQNDILLVDSRLTICATNDRGAPCYCSVLFSALRLRKDDRIFVEIDHYSHLDRRPESSFFGIYILG